MARTHGLTVLRPFRGWDDLHAMESLCSAILLASPGRASVHPGDIAWWVGWRVDMDKRGDSFLLWEVEEEVVGFAAVDDGDLAVFVSPARAGTPAAVNFEDAALAWAGRDDAPVRWVEFEDDDAVARWRDRGLRPTDEAYPNLVRPLADVNSAAPGDGRVPGPSRSGLRPCAAPPSPPPSPRRVSPADSWRDGGGGSPSRCTR